MSENVILKRIASEYVDGEIDKEEFVGRVLEELAYGHSTSFWCKVMQMKEDHDYTK